MEFRFIRRSASFLYVWEIDKVRILGWKNSFVKISWVTQDNVGELFFVDVYLCTIFQLYYIVCGKWVYLIKLAISNSTFMIFKYRSRIL